MAGAEEDTSPVIGLIRSNFIFGSQTSYRQAQRAAGFFLAGACAFSKAVAELQI
jgi:hypothetical protein